MSGAADQLGEGTAELFVGATETSPNGLRATGFVCGDPLIYLRDAAGEVLCVSQLELGRARLESHVADVISFDEAGHSEALRQGRSGPSYWAHLVGELLRQRGIDRVLVEDGFPLGLADQLRAQDVSIEPSGARFDDRRRSKSEAEVQLLIAVQRANERAIHRAIAAIRASEPDADGVLMLEGAPLTSERVRAIAGACLLEDGCQGADMIVAGGAQGANPHDRGSGPLRAGEPIIIDSFPQHLGSRYFADMTRTVVWGEPDPEVERMYQVCLEAQEAALREIRAGVTGRQVHEVVCRTIHDAGYRTLMPPYDSGDGETVMNHGTGHGLGLAIHEAPRLSDTPQVLVEGDVVTVEPGIYHPRLGGIRIEDVVVVTRDGCRNITEFPKDFRLQ